MTNMRYAQAFSFFCKWILKSKTCIDITHFDFNRIPVCPYVTQQDILRFLRCIVFWDRFANLQDVQMWGANYFFSSIVKYIQQEAMYVQRCQIYLFINGTWYNMAIRHVTHVLVHKCVICLRRTGGRLRTSVQHPCFLGVGSNIAHALQSLMRWSNLYFCVLYHILYTNLYAKLFQVFCKSSDLYGFDWEILHSVPWNVITSEHCVRCQAFGSAKLSIVILILQ